MHRLILACLGLLLTGTDPAPAPAPNSKLAEVYTLRFEEKGFDMERPLPAGQKPVDIATLEDKLIVSTDVEIRPGQPFRVRVKQRDRIRIVAGRSATEWDDKGRLSVEIACAVYREVPDAPPDCTRVKSTAHLKVGETFTIGGFTSTGVSVHPDGDIEEHRRTVFEVTLLEKTKDELEE